MSVSHAAARVYAGALFDIGVEDGSLPSISQDLHAVRAAIDGLDTRSRAFLEMPQVRREDKWRVVNEAFEGKVGRPALGLLHVLVDKRRELLLDAIVTEFDDLADKHAGRIQATVVTARQLDAGLIEALQAAIAQRTRRDVVLRQRVDPNMIGGIRVSLGDLVVDGTLRRALSDMRRALAGSLT